MFSPHRLSDDFKLLVAHGGGRFDGAAFFWDTGTDMISKKQAWKNIREDIVALGVSVLLAWFLFYSEALTNLLAATETGKILESFAVGIFFTSAFTLAPASLFLAKLSQVISPWLVAFFGALGAMCGDLILFLFIRDRLASDIKALFPKGVVRHVLRSFHFGFWKWLAPLLGALIIASPLPDEFGISLLGLSRVRVAVLLPIAFVMNFLGILLIIAVARTL